MWNRKSNLDCEINTLDWKDANLEHGRSFLKIKVPPYCDILKMGYVPTLENPGEKIEKALSNPIKSPPLEDIIRSYKDPSRVTLAIAVSDNTRPVPYHTEREDGILLPLLKRVEKVGVKPQNMTIVVATGTHLAASNDWKKEAFGDYIKNRYRIVDHDSTSSELSSLGKIDGIPVKINREFLQADIHVITGLVEPHFMAGVSGGRKAVCPGLINLEATHLFHGPEFMDNPLATNLVLEGNSYHGFALKVASKTRVDFSVNVTLDSEGKLSGVFADHLNKAHLGR